MGMPSIALQPFGRDDFDRLIGWLPSEGALIAWCAAFFRYPLDHAQLERYLASAEQPNTRVIFTAFENTNAVGHIEISHIWPHLSSRLSRVIVAPEHRRRGIGEAVVGQALSYSFSEHHVDHIDLGVSASNDAAIACYRKLGFRHVGTWPKAMATTTQVINVHWMTVGRADWAASRCQN
ncbi:MAG: GNAT family N-acetyltransferase [Hyphomicrobiaceae bacterium]